jgi:hypothetical protein
MERSTLAYIPLLKRFVLFIIFSTSLFSPIPDLYIHYISFFCLSDVEAWFGTKYIYICASEVLANAGIDLYGRKMPFPS